MSCFIAVPMTRWPPPEFRRHREIRRNNRLGLLLRRDENSIKMSPKLNRFLEDSPSRSQKHCPRESAEESSSWPFHDIVIILDLVIEGGEMRLLEQKIHN